MVLTIHMISLMAVEETTQVVWFKYNGTPYSAGMLWLVVLGHLTSMPFISININQYLIFQMSRYGLVIN